MEDRRKVGESSCNFGDGTDQRVQSLMFMMMMIGHCDGLIPSPDVSTERQRERGREGEKRQLVCVCH